MEQIAIVRPAMVHKPVIVTPAFNPGSFHPGLMENMEALQPEHLAEPPFAEEYASIAPNPQDWLVLINKTKRLDLEFVGWPSEIIASIKAPTLIIIGDSDIVRPEHAVELLRLLGGGVNGDLAGLTRSQLAVLPGTTHIGLVDRADWLVSMITKFLDTPGPA